MTRENLTLGARQVILVNVANGFEQLRAERVVKVLWEQLSGFIRESLQNVAGKFSLPVVARQIVNDQSRGRLFWF